MLEFVTFGARGEARAPQLARFARDAAAKSGFAPSGYAYAGGCVILRAFCGEKPVFSVPIPVDGGDAEAAFGELEADCRETGTRLRFAGVFGGQVGILEGRYGARSLSWERGEPRGEAPAPRMVTVLRASDLLDRPPEIATERLVLRAMGDGDAAAFYRLAADRVRNRYWGYDWRADYPAGDPPEDWFLRSAREDFARRDEISLGIYRGEFMGELVFHRFGYRGEAELGVRLLPEAEGNGYAAEAMRAAGAYARGALGLRRVEARCRRENARSERMLRAAGFVPCGGDARYIWFLWEN